MANGAETVQIQTAPISPNGSSITLGRVLWRLGPWAIGTSGLSYFAAHAINPDWFLRVADKYGVGMMVGALGIAGGISFGGLMYRLAIRLQTQLLDFQSETIRDLRAFGDAHTAAVITLEANLTEIARERDEKDRARDSRLDLLASSMDRLTEEHKGTIAKLIARQR